MQVSVQYFVGCPNWRNAGQRLRQGLDQIGRADTDIDFAAVRTDADAAAVGFAGSPTFIIDGVDLFGPAPTAGGLTCRVYATPGGPAGVPEVADLITALTRNRPWAYGGVLRTGRVRRVRTPRPVPATAQRRCRTALRPP